jgi:hypothetical protein
VCLWTAINSRGKFNFLSFFSITSTESNNGGVVVWVRGGNETLTCALVNETKFLFNNVYVKGRSLFISDLELAKKG